jgi:hypothetical protein
VKIRTFVAAFVIAGCATYGVQPKEFSGDKSAALPDDLPAAKLEGAGPVIVAPEVVEGWRFLYRFVTETEFVLCLEGRRSSNQIYIESFRLARMEASNSSSVRYQPCGGERYIGTAHNHPPVSSSKSLCYQSLPDRRSFEADTRAVIDIVLCGDNRFLWVTRDDGHKSSQYGEAVATLTDSIF